MKSEPSRTFIGSVVCVDLVGYSKRTVDEQIAIKGVFNRVLSQVIRNVRPEDRIILDTGDGAAISFLGDPDECLNVGLEMRDALMEAAEKLGAASGEGPVRIGMNLGPLKVALDMNGHPNIIGDGLNAAERVMGFAQPGQIVASRSFHEMVSRLSAEHGGMFRYEGKRTDKNAREHEIYIVEDRRRVRRAAAAKTAARKASSTASAPAAQAAPMAAGAAATPTAAPIAAPAPAAASATAAATLPASAPKAASPASAPEPSPAQASGLVRFLRDPVKVWVAGGVLMAIIFGEAWMLDRKHQGAAENVAAIDPAAQAKSEPASPPAKPSPVDSKPELAAKESTPPGRAEPSPAKMEPAAPRAQIAAAPQPSAPTPPIVARKAEPQPARPERSKEEPPAPGSPMAIAQAAREKADAARTPATASKRFEEPQAVATRPAAMPAAPQAQPTPAPPPAQPAQPAAPPPAQVAAATAVATPIHRVPVGFPRAAAQQGIESGVVKAKLAINAEGRVTEVTLLGSNPPRIFDREAIRALEEWRFNAGAGNRFYEVEIEFKR